MECDNFSLRAPTLLVGRQEQHPACKNVLGVGVLFVIDLTGALHIL